jgi:hypothetical protein
MHPLKRHFGFLAALACLACAAAARTSRLDVSKVETDGLKLYVETRGYRPDTLVVLHGGPGLSAANVLPDLGPLIARS